MAAGIAEPRCIDAAIRVSAQLDARFHLLVGDALVTTKEQAFVELFRVLERERTAYALIGGVAIQLWQREPRTTLDIDVAVRAYGELPELALREAGFRHLKTHPHSDNWLGPNDVPVQFSCDPAFATAISTAVEREVGGVTVRVASTIELVHAKLRAAADVARRRSKRLQDLSDAHALIEDDAALKDALTEAEKQLLAM